MWKRPKVSHNKPGGYLYEPGVKTEYETEQIFVTWLHHTSRQEREKKGSLEKFLRKISTHSDYEHSFTESKTAMTTPAFSVFRLNIHEEVSPR